VSAPKELFRGRPKATDQQCDSNRLKQFRRLATRYDKLARRFNVFLLLACTYIWLL